MSANLKKIEKLKLAIGQPYADTLEGVLAVGGPMTAELLSFSYEHGVFPWPHEGYPLLWFCPDERGVIDFEDLHLSRSFKKWLKKNEAVFNITHDKSFKEVVRACRTVSRLGQKGTWINNEIEKNYLELFKMGQAFSVEIWRGESLVGGVYGVKSKLYFSCESMFHTESNTSKLALYSLIQHLSSQGVKWIDIQMVTSVCESFGGKLIDKNEFLQRIQMKRIRPYSF